MNDAAPLLAIDNLVVEIQSMPALRGFTMHIAKGAMVSLVQSCLGLGFDPEGSTILFDEPVLPDFVEDATLRQLSLRGARLDVRVARVAAEVAVHVISRSGQIRAVTRV